MQRFLFFIWLVFLFGCSSGRRENLKPPTGTGIFIPNRDTLTRPANDLFTYVNGGWLTRTSIPADRGNWGAFNELREHNSNVLLEILNSATENDLYLEGTDERKAIDFFRVGMDSLLAEKFGLEPLKEIRQKIERIANRIDLQKFLVEEDLMGGDAFFDVNISPDKRNSQVMAVYLGSGGIGLPERDYYFKADQKSKEIRDAYREHMIRLLTLGGWDVLRSRKSADRIMAIETDLARATPTKEDRRDELKQYNKKGVGELPTFVSSINWDDYLGSLGIKVDSVIVKEPDFLRGYQRAVDVYSLDDLKSYLWWSCFRSAAPFLNQAVVRESFEFNTHYLNGATKMRPRKKRVLSDADNYLGEALGKLYVAEVFPPEAKAKAKEMVENIRFAFAERIKQLDWMSDSTKRMALKKLSGMVVKIGYPDTWRNYGGLVIDKSPDKGSYYNAIQSAKIFRVREGINSLGKPVDRAVWNMPPQTVNAFYGPQFNEIVFPAGILQRPFYDYRADEAVNFGGIGGVIGHEISHGFDDQGGLYDANGNLKNWWTAEDMRKFRQKGAALAAQFGAYQPLPGIFLQGQYTLGENIADLGGLNAAFDGLQRFYREHQNKPGLVEGMTPEQRFFMSWAAIWRAKYRDETLRTLILTNEHSPAPYRANGPPSNMDEFYKAFGVKPGDKMFREEKERVRIW